MNQLAEPPTDKGSANFCEFFIPNLGLAQQTENNLSTDATKQLNALFGEDDTPEPAKNPLDDLFND